MKTTNQITLEKLENATAKSIVANFWHLDYNCAEITESTGTLIELVAKNANDFTKDIAEKNMKSIVFDSDNKMTVKQCWCIAYQIVNNIEVYKAAMVEYMNETI